jgi:predicted phosphodiesterase
VDDLDEIRALAAEDEKSAALRRALRALDKANATKAELVAAVYQAAKDAASAMRIPPVTYRSAKARVGKADDSKAETAICLLADWQFGKVTPEYDSEVARARVLAYADKVVDIIGHVRRHHPVDEARVYLLGDLVEGELIFPGQAHRIDASLYRQVFDGAELLAQVVRRIASAVPSVKVRGVIGNHGDIGGRSRREMHPETNADAMLMNIARLHLPGVDFPEPIVKGERAWHIVDEVKGRRWMLVHGNQIKGSSFGVPWYGFKNKALGWHSTLGPFDYLASGHWHQQIRHDINGIQHFGAGSPESANTYAQEWLAGGGQRGSQYLIFQNERGLTSEWPIRL